MDTGYWIQDTGYSILNTGYWILDTRYKIQEYLNYVLEYWIDCFTPGKVGATGEKIQPVLQGVSGLFYFRQGRRNERRDPTCPPGRFRIVLLHARSEKREKRSNPSFREFQDCFTPLKVGASRENIQPVLPGVSGLFYSRQGQRNERRDLSRPPRSFRIVLLQARSEQLEKISNPSYQEFQDCFTPV